MQYPCGGLTRMDGLTSLVVLGDSIMDSKSHLSVVA
jgi:hypothetical protein